MRNYKKNKIKLLNFSLILVLTILLSALFVKAVPPLPTEIYGTAKSYNQFVASGVIISVYDSQNNLCGTYRTVNTSWNASYFGVLTCRGEDDVSPGPTEGEVLSFRIGSAYASAIAYNGAVGNVTTNDSKYFNYSQVSVIWQSGTFKEVIIVAPPLVCGDAFCDMYENCNSCALDCDACPTGNATGTGNSTGNTSGGGAGTGGAGGAGAGGTGGAGAGGAGGTGGTAGDAGDASAGDEQAGEGAILELVCTEDWMCGDWQECLPDSVQLRDCVDLNECGTSDDMPIITQTCEYTGELYGINRSYINRTNPTPPRRESPALISVCKDKLPLFSLSSLIFICLLAIIIFIAESDYRKRLKRIDADTSLDELKKLELKYFEKRKKVIFFVVIIVLAIIVYLYHYFFYVCKDKYVLYLWLLASGILMTPVIVHLLIELSIFSESEKNKRVSILNDIHYKHFELLVEIADRELIVAERNIVNRLYDLEQKPEFNTWLAKDKIVIKIYADMTKLFNLYKTLNNPMFVEKDLLESIRKLDEDEEFVNATKVYPELMAIKANLSLLYSAYEYKQTLYDELSSIEKEYGLDEPLVR